MLILQIEHMFFFANKIVETTVKKMLERIFYILLLEIYINDIPEALSHLCRLYVDDGKTINVFD